MSSNPTSRSTMVSHSRPLPTERDLDQLASHVRAAGREQEFNEQILDHYESWIFLFVGWCLRVPPYRIEPDRIGAFWRALTQRRIPRWKVCAAMDALGFLFGTIGGPEALPLPTAPETGATDPLTRPHSTGRENRRSESASVPAWRRAPTPNPTLCAADSDQEWRGRTDLGDGLPDGSLPMGVNARATVPVVGKQDGGREATASASHAPKTLFNPEGQASSSDARAGTDDGDPRSQNGERKAARVAPRLS